jgi:hypothetical protein
MATRNKPNNSHETVLKGIFEGSSKTLAVTLDDLKAFTQLSTMDALSLMVDMEEAKLIETAGRGENMVGWLFSQDSQTGLTRTQVASELSTLTVEKPKRKRRTPAEMEAARAKQNAKVAYAAARDFELDALSNGATPEEAANARKSYEGEAMDTETNETLNEPESAPVEAPKPFVMEEHKSALEERDLILDEPESILAKPEGVSDNAWYMAHAAITQTARDWWLNYCHTQAMSEALDAS